MHIFVCCSFCDDVSYVQILLFIGLCLSQIYKQIENAKVNTYSVRLICWIVGQLLCCKSRMTISNSKEGHKLKRTLLQNRERISTKILISPVSYTAYDIRRRLQIPSIFWNFFYWIHLFTSRKNILHTIEAFLWL